MLKNASIIYLGLLRATCTELFVMNLNAPASMDLAVAKSESANKEVEDIG